MANPTATATITAINMTDATFSCHVIGPSRLLISFILGVSTTFDETIFLEIDFKPKNINDITKSNPSINPASEENKNAVITQILSFRQI